MAHVKGIATERSVQMNKPPPPQVTSADWAAALGFIRDKFDIGQEDLDPLIDLPQVAALAGVAQNTPMIWRQRSRPDYAGPGKLQVPFPPPDDTRYRDKPQWRLSTALGWLVGTRRWPRGAVARPETRGPRAA